MKLTISMPPATNLVLNKILSFGILITFWFSLSSCSSGKNVIPFAPVTTKHEMAAVYIYRPNEVSNALYAPGININGDFKFYAKRGISSRVSLAPGEYIFEFQPEKKYYELMPLSLNLDAGKIYYIRVNTALKITDETNYKPYQRSFTLKQIKEPQALIEITECCNKHDKKSSAKSGDISNRQNSKEGFSVDKTQNPFSH